MPMESVVSSAISEWETILCTSDSLNQVWAQVVPEPLLRWLILRYLFCWNSCICLFSLYLCGSLLLLRVGLQPRCHLIFKCFRSKSIFFSELSVDSIKEYPEDLMAFICYVLLYAHINKYSHCSQSGFEDLSSDHSSCQLQYVG
ncbi:putative protein SCAI [Dioscorea sansibarensis]